MLFSWEHLKYQNSHPGAHFGTGLGEPWGGCSEPEISFRAIATWIKNISRVSVAKRGRYELIQVTCTEIILSHF